MADNECREADCAIGSAEIWDANTPIWMDAASTRPTARNTSVARIITSRRSSMSKGQATEKWVVEVRRAHAVEHRPRATGAAWLNAMTVRPPSPWPMPCRTSCELDS